MNHLKPPTPAEAVPASRLTRSLLRSGSILLAARQMMGRRRGLQIAEDERGATLVEMALVSMVLFAIVFAIIEFAMVMYSYHFVSEAARETTRYAAVRGSNSCTSSSSLLANCNLGPTTTGQPLQDFVVSTGYPGLDPTKFTVTGSWWVASNPNVTNYVAWSTQCTGLKDSVSVPCNFAGNLVKVNVQYVMPIGIPFWRNGTITLTSSSTMVITN